MRVGEKEGERIRNFWRLLRVYQGLRQGVLDEWGLAFFGVVLRSLLTMVG